MEKETAVVEIVEETAKRLSPTALKLGMSVVGVVGVALLTQYTIKKIKARKEIKRLERDDSGLSPALSGPSKPETKGK